VTTVRVDLDLALCEGSEGSRLHVCYALHEGRVAALAASGSAPVELRVFDISGWQSELESRLVVPASSQAPTPPARTVELPWDLLVGTGQALARRRPGAYDELVAREPGTVRADGVMLDLAAAHEQLRRLHHGVLARLQAVCSGIRSGRRRIGWTSWLLYADGWRELTPYVGRMPDGAGRSMVRVEPRRPTDLAAQVARWAVAVGA
jgi:hypothetical protein